MILTSETYDGNLDRHGVVGTVLVGMLLHTAM